MDTYPQVPHPIDSHVYDLIGLGFGPSNLSVAIAAQEESAGKGAVDDLYLDARDGFSWHPGMMFEDARLQVVYLKDLITMQNPRSRYTFLNYLFENDRLHDFINLRALYPTRIEFNDYYCWVANQFRDKVRYNEEVVDVVPLTSESGEIDLLRVVVFNRVTGQRQEYLTRNLIYADGGTPRIPSGIEVRPGGRVFHSSQCLLRLEESFADRTAPYHFVVVGSGQTAADILYFLLTRYTNARVTSAMRGFAFKPQDDTHFVNQLFFPEVVDLLYGLPEEKRRRFMNRHRDVTHSAVDMDLLPLLYDILYNEKVTGRRRTTIHPFLDLTGAREDAGSVTAVFRHVMTEEAVEIEADAVIMGTGYARKTPIPLLAKADPYLCTTSAGTYEIERYYAVRRRPGFRPKIYLQGYAEATHGFSEVLLSIMPVRASEMLADIRANLADHFDAFLAAAPHDGEDLSFVASSA